MKTCITALLLLLTFTFCGQEKDATVQNPQVLTWGGKASVGGYAPEGTLAIKDMQIQVDETMIQTLEVIIDMKSLYQENERLTNHLKDKDFFDVNKFPTASFTLTETFTIGKSENLIGIMTIKGKTQQEQIPVQVTFENGQIKLRFTHNMNRLDYGIIYNSTSIFKSLKENAIADMFTLKGTLILIPRMAK